MAFVERYVTTSAAGGGDGSAGDPWTLAEAASSAVAGDRVNVQAGTYVLGASFSPDNDGTNESPIVWRGYVSAPGDADMPVVTFDIDGVSAHVVDCAKAYHRFENITATGNAGDGGSVFGFNLSGEVNILFCCRVTQANRGVSVVGQGSQVIASEVDHWTLGAGIQLSADNAAAIGCFVHDGGGFGCGFSAPSSGGYYYCVSANNVSHGFVAGQSGAELHRWLVHCTAHGNGGDGIAINGTPDGQPFVIVNCLSICNALYGIGGALVSTGTPHVTLLGIGFFDNSSGEIRDGVKVFEPYPRVSLAEDVMVDPGAGDFRLTPGAVGALGVGFPGRLLVDGAIGSWGSSPDLGAIQQAVRPLVNPSFVGAF
ncbi:MAG TPA: right-handed parallel beta-helix repeat-containing protein [Phycisphaerae bacterium]|nr:right-handed parallel beta-helix repeat-containing protein [Phycisphaerae bacterium]